VLSRNVGGLIIASGLALVLAAAVTAARPATGRAVVSEAESGKPPRAVLRTSAPGLQRGSMYSGSVSTFLPDGPGTIMIWETGNSEPRRLSVVRPGERLVIRFRGAATMSGSGGLYRNGCEQRAPRRSFAVTGPRVVWRVPRRFRPGRRFELNVGGEFTMATPEGISVSGSTSWSFGLLVVKNRSRPFVRNRGSLACGEDVFRVG
jgi:hypothetical protein